MGNEILETRSALTGKTKLVCVNKVARCSHQNLLSQPVLFKIVHQVFVIERQSKSDSLYLFDYKHFVSLASNMYYPV